MLARDGDRMIAGFVHPVQVGDTFTEWPLHVTIVSWFRTTLSTSQLDAVLAEAYKGVEPFVTTVGPEAYFGPLRSTLVNLITLPNQFTELFNRTMQVVNRHAIKMVAKPHNPYRPHVTVHKHGRVHEGQTISCDRLYVIRYCVEDGRRFKRIEAEVVLG